MVTQEAEYEQHNECPLPNTHSRLEQAHRLWHQALEAYDDPEGFRANLNSTIEALRNVTFMLQSEKLVIPDFDDWYAKQQEMMKADIIMKWLGRARTTVVHKSDLKTQSTAHAIVHNNLTLARFTAELSPLVPTLAAAMTIAKELPEPFASNRRDLVLSVERRWCVPELSDRELLDALAYAYGLLSKVVKAAHERVGAQYEQRGPHAEAGTGPDGVLPCMITTVEARTVRVSLADFQAITSSTKAVHIDESDVEKAKRRYGFAKGATPIPSYPEDPLTFAKSLVPVAKAVLARDKYHSRLAFLHTPTGWQMVQLDAHDRSEKYAAIAWLTQMIRRYQADAIVEVGEVWVSSLGGLEEGRLPSEDPKRQEALAVSVATSDGSHHVFTTPFRRTAFGSVRFGQTEANESMDPTYLTPIFEVWNLPLPGSDKGENPEG